MQFTYETYSKTCMLFAGYAEIYRTDGLMSGVVSSAIVSTASDATALKSSISDERPAEAPDVGGGADNAAMAWMNQPPPPVPPALRFGAESPPPSPPPGELEATKIIVADMSMGIASLMGLGFCICAYCFFREDFLAVADKAKRAKNKTFGGGSGKPGHKGYGVAPNDSDGDYDAKHGGGGGGDGRGGSSRRDKKGRRGKRNGRGGGEAEREAGYVQVRLEVGSLTQRRQVFVGLECPDLPTLQAALWNEFSHALRETKESDMLLLCEDPYGASDGGKAWLRVTAQSDVPQVVEAGALKLIERPKEGPDPDDEYEVAFPMEEPEAALAPQPRSRERKPKGGKSKQRASEMDAVPAAGGGRFSDDILEADEAPHVNELRFADEDSS